MTDFRMKTVTALVLKDETTTQDGKTVKTGRYILWRKRMQVFDFYALAQSPAASRAPARFADPISNQREAPCRQQS